MNFTECNCVDIFNDLAKITAESEVPCNSFTNHMQTRYGNETIKNILNAFYEIGLPAPEGYQEFVMGCEGDLVFLERYGLVLRIESKKEMQRYWGDKNIQVSPFVSKPVASIDAGEAYVQICPGVACPVGKYDESSLNRFLGNHLSVDNIDYYDKKIDNVGVMPVSTPHFPLGIPIVIDRGAIREQTCINLDLRDLNEEQCAQMAVEAEEAAAAEEALYAPLRLVFDAAWPDKTKPADAAKMKLFLSLCREQVNKKKLIGSWENTDDLVSAKSKRAIITAETYESRLLSAEQLHLSIRAPGL